MNRPDEIAALADRIERSEGLVIGEGQCDDNGRGGIASWIESSALHDSDVKLIVSALRLAATPPGDAVREALTPFSNLLRLYDSYESEFGKPLNVGVEISDIRNLISALAPAEKARDELKVACASCKKIPGPHCQRPTCAFRDYIDTRTVKTVLAMTSSELSVIPASAVESGREMARQAIAATPKPPGAHVAKWTCMGRRQSLPEPGECDWPNCGCDPHATKVIESLLEQDWRAPPAPLPWDAFANRSHEPTETRAKEIYDAFEHDGVGTKPAWVDGGNGIKQDEARMIARREIRARQSAAHGGGTEGGEA